MTIKAVEQAIRHARKVIRKHPKLGSETKTRYYLIDPVVHALGWKTDSPWEVGVEHRNREGRPDYTLLTSKGEEAIIIESKALTNNLSRQQGRRQTSAERQLSGYIRQIKRGRGVLTNGKVWRIYDAGKKGTLRTKLIESVDIENLEDRGLRDTAKVLYDELKRTKWR